MPEHTTARDGEPFAGADGRAAGGEPDYYSVLGVRPDVSDDEIRHAFHRLAKLWHPDRYMAAPAPLRERAERRMRALIAAHEVLGDPVRRHAYDRRYGHPVAALHAEHQRGEHAGSGPIHPHAGYTAAAAAYTEGIQDAPTTTGNPNGAGQFFGLICSFLALGILVYQLGHGDGSFGSLVGIGAVLVLGGLAVWFFVEGSPPSRMATSWMKGIPTARAAGGGAHYRKPHHKHRHGGHHAGPEDAPPEQPTSEEQTSEESTEAPPTDFERLVAEALAGIPAEFQRYMENVAVRVQAEPSEEDLATLGVREGGLLLGLYHGVALTHQHAAGAPAPEEITIYQRPIERYCHHDPTRIREQVRRTVLHELAHHFGIDHEDMPDWVR